MVVDADHRRSGDRGGNAGFGSADNSKTAKSRSKRSTSINVPNARNTAMSASSKTRPVDAPATIAAAAGTTNLSNSAAVESWYGGVMSLFGTTTEERNDGRSNPSSASTTTDMISSGLTSFADMGLTSYAPSIPHNSDDVRDDVENESTSSGTVSTLGRGLGDDLKSLPSINAGILPGEDGNNDLEFDHDFSGMSGSVRRGTASASPRASSTSNRTRDLSKDESVESLIDMKIQNLRSERSTREPTQSVPYLRRKVYPMAAGRDDTEYIGTDSKDPDSILESRRQLLVRELRQAVKNYGRFDVRCANITAALADLYDENREFKQSLRLHQDAVSVYSTKLGDHHQKTLDAKLRMAQVYDNSGDYDSAISIFYFVMNMMKATNKENDPSASDVTARIAGSLQKKGNHELAIKTLKRSLKKYREILGDTHPSVSSTVDSIASLYITLGDFSKASAILEEVVKLKAATMGVSSNEVAASLCELATSYECAEQYSKAMKNLKKAYKIYADIVGESGEKSILTLERIALIYQATGQFKKAAIAYLGVLRGRKRALGESHPTVADTYFHLGVSLRESNQQEKAFKCMKQALNIYVGEGKDMHDVEMIAEVMHELAIIHKANHNTGDAIKTFKQEIAVRQKLGQPEYPFIAQTLNHLGVAEFEVKNCNRALNYFMEALTIYEKRGGALGTDFAEVLYNTGLVFESLRNRQRARDAFVEAARIFRANGYTESHPHYAKAVGKLRRMGISSSEILSLTQGMGR
mmetsp:Transcript_4035/g.9941  ORF Transcript_4035/g.9941 Transcript_4035/m.9941 type:complete len:754 (+) Transcript_4035:208-2469(+)